MRALFCGGRRICDCLFLHFLLRSKRHSKLKHFYFAKPLNWLYFVVYQTMHSQIGKNSTSTDPSSKRIFCPSLNLRWIIIRWTIIELRIRFEFIPFAGIWHRMSHEVRVAFGDELVLLSRVRLNCRLMVKCKIIFLYDDYKVKLTLRYLLTSLQQAIYHSIKNKLS